ncbi:helix-turn-helix transcriptional regulator [Leuconostoc palmae]|uniref:helix-turn-helix transcriptional regulator n=1 Tax=Leuconostoc palmae TaxID=501487 RepID=UPI001C7E1A00|nr:helix-turn-helix transcriptional regulator [Leuconostoc palmae]
MKTRIQELRKARHMTQADLAKALKVTRQTIISLEKEKYNASLFLAYDIAHFFGLSIEEVFIFDKGVIHETKNPHQDYTENA